MSTGFSDGPAPGARRGRRDPNLAQQLAAGQMQPGLDEDELRDPSEGPEPDGVLMLMPGAICGAKITQAVSNKGGDAWVTYSAQDRMQDNEDEPDLWNRLANVVVGRTYDLADITFEQGNEMYDRHQAVRGRIVPRT